jgi:hypothetical protein
MKRIRQNANKSQPCSEILVLGCLTSTEGEPPGQRQLTEDQSPGVSFFVRRTVNVRADRQTWFSGPREAGCSAGGVTGGEDGRRPAEGAQPHGSGVAAGKSVASLATGGRRPPAGLSIGTAYAPSLDHVVITGVALTNRWVLP